MKRLLLPFCALCASLGVCVSAATTDRLPPAAALPPPSFAGETDDIALASAAIGHPVEVGNVRVTPLALVEDSRCPMNARCVRAGQVVLSVRIEGEGWTETANLTLGQPRRVHGANVTLTSVLPERMAGDRPQPMDYEFGFEGEG